MNESNKNDFTLDDDAAARFSDMLESDGGVMRAGFVIHEANNLNDLPPKGSDAQ